MADKFKPIWDKRHEIDNARREKQKQCMDKYMEEIYLPAVLQLKKDCGELGHHEGSFDRHYHDNGIGWAWLECSYCHERIKVWLHGVELQCKDGKGVNDGKTWIKVDGTPGESCVDEDDEKDE